MVTMVNHVTENSAAVQKLAITWIVRQSQNAIKDGSVILRSNSLKKL